MFFFWKAADSQEPEAFAVLPSFLLIPSGFYFCVLANYCLGFGRRRRDDSGEESCRMVVNSPLTKTSSDGAARACLRPRPTARSARRGTTRPNTDASHSPSIYKSLPTVTVIAALGPPACVCKPGARPKTRKAAQTHTARVCVCAVLSRRSTRKKKRMSDFYDYFFSLL